jgi:hypothetical protein
MKFTVEYSHISASNYRYQWIAYETGDDGEGPHEYGATPVEALSKLMEVLGQDSVV